MGCARYRRCRSARYPPWARPARDRGNARQQSGPGVRPRDAGRQRMARARWRRLIGALHLSIVPPCKTGLPEADSETPMIDMTASGEIASDARVKANVVRLAAAQVLTGANSAVIFATGSIIGATLAPSVSLATVPLSMYVLGLAAGTLPTGAISRAYGRRVAFIIGTGCGTVTGLLGAFAILHSSFWLFCCATFIGGLYGAVSQSYRFAAADGASAAYRPKAVSWVMAGGVFAGVLGP